MFGIFNKGVFRTSDLIYSTLYSNSNMSIIPPTGVWILFTGFWEDSGAWDDNAVWID